MDLNLSAEFLLQIFIYMISLGITFGKLTSRMDHHDFKLDKLEESQEEKLVQLDRNHSEKIERLEKKQDKHNHLIERMYNIEQIVAVIKSEKSSLSEKVHDLETDVDKLKNK